MSSSPAVWSISKSDKFSFLTPIEWQTLWNSEGLAKPKYSSLPIELEDDEFPYICAKNRHTFTVVSQVALTDKKINKLVKNFKLPDDVHLDWKRDENGVPLFTFTSQTEDRNTEFLSKAIKWTSYDGRIRSPRYSNPAYGIAPKYY